MSDSTNEGGVSSTNAAQDVSEKEAMADRVELIKKAVTRLNEVTERVELITRAAKGAIPELVKNHPLGEVMEIFTLFEGAVDRHAVATVELGKINSYAREVSLPERLDDDAIKTFTADNGDRMSRTARAFASVKAGMMDKAFEWLRANELGSLIKETLNSSSLSGAAKELMENGKELPDDIFALHIKNGVSITRKKKD